MKTVSLTWENISASVNEKAILKNCSGYCKPGQMLAIMGPSGAGKTTLLSLLSKRQSSSLHIQGQVLANNQHFDSQKFYQFGSFVYQNDLLFENLTVRQTLEFAAFLKIPNRQRAVQKVQWLIEEFELQKCAETYVGGVTTKGISGGQKKRLCVSIQMVSNPSLIILDQPTSGLDSNKAARLLSVLRKLASKNHTIIFTIHQPSYLQYIRLDRLIVLDRGETIYQGYANKIGDYLTQIGIKVPQDKTISDFFMMEISQFKKSKQSQLRGINFSSVTIAKETMFSSQNYSLRISPENLREIKKIKQSSRTLDLNEIHMSSFFYSFGLLLRRNYLNIFRGKWKIRVIAMQTIMKIIIIGIIYMDQIPSPQALNNSNDPIRQFLFAQTTSFSNTSANLVTALSSVSLTLPAQRQLYYKETDSKKYSPLPYFLSKVISEYSLVFIGTIIYASIAYWLTGYTRDLIHFLNYSNRIFYTVSIALTLIFVGNSLGFFIATLFREISRVSSLTSLITFPMLMLSGLFNKLNSIPEWSSWLQYISPYRYGLHLFLLNQYGDSKFGKTEYDYRDDLGITLTYQQNFMILVGEGIIFYSLSFLLLKFYTSRIAP